VADRLFNVVIEHPRAQGPGAVAALATAIAARYGIPAADLERRLARGRFRVKSKVDRETADTYAADLTRLGAVCVVLPAEESSTQSMPAVSRPIDIAVTSAPSTDRMARVPAPPAPTAAPTPTTGQGPRVAAPAASAAAPAQKWPTEAPRTEISPPARWPDEAPRTELTSQAGRPRWPDEAPRTEVSPPRAPAPPADDVRFPVTETSWPIVTKEAPRTVTEPARPRPATTPPPTDLARGPLPLAPPPATPAPAPAPATPAARPPAPAPAAAHAPATTPVAAKPAVPAAAHAPAPVAAKPAVPAAAHAPAHPPVAPVPAPAAKPIAPAPAPAARPVAPAPAPAARPVAPAPAPAARPVAPAPAPVAAKPAAPATPAPAPGSPLDLGALSAGMPLTLSTLDGAAAEKAAGGQGSMLPASFGPAREPTPTPGPLPAAAASPPASTAPVPADLFAPPTAAAVDVVLDTAAPTRRELAAAAARTAATGAAPEVPWPATTLPPRISETRGAVTGVPAIEGGTARATGLNPYARVVAGAVLAVGLGFIPAHLVGAMRENAAYADLDRDLTRREAAIRSRAEYDAFDTVRAAYAERKRAARTSIAVTSIVLWVLVGAGVAWLWFRRISPPGP
jgi:hypothetical protein